MSIPPSGYDPRAVGNLLLDEAGEPITHLALQKLLYFAHGLYLIAYKRPLVSGYFEAWQHGPVHPAVYKAFKRAGGEPITFRACRRDILTGNETPLDEPAEPEARKIVRQVILQMGTFSPHRLRQLSHAPRAPWARIVEQGSNGIAFGLRISDDLIVEHFRFHKIQVVDEEDAEDPKEDAPFNSRD